MTLLPAELRKVWGLRIFPVLLVMLACANLLLLWGGTRPSANQPSAAAIRAVCVEMQGMDMPEKGEFLHENLRKSEALLKLKNYYQELAYGSAALSQYRTQNSALFEEYEQAFLEKSYTLYTEDLAKEYRLFDGLAREYDTVADYASFLEGVQAKAGQLATISIFQNDSTGYDLKNIEKTAQAYAVLENIEIEYYPQKGLYTALNYRYTDLLLLAAMLLLALLLIRQERDNGLLNLIRSQPAGRLKTALAKLTAFGLSLFAILVLLYGVNLLYCAFSFGLGPLARSIQSVPALMRCTMQITVWEYLFRFLLAKWAGAFAMGVWVLLAALLPRRATNGWLAALLLPLGAYAIRAIIPATGSLNVIKYANLASLLQTNELLGNYRNLYWFGSPVGLPLVEWSAAVVYIALFAGAFCLVYTRATLLPAASHSFRLRSARKTRAVTVQSAERQKLFLQCGAGVAILAFVAFGAYQGTTSQSYITADEIYYSYYMKELSGPLTQERAAWYNAQKEEFQPLLEAQRKVQSGELNSEALFAYAAQQQKYDVYQTVYNTNYQYLTQHKGAWFVYESGYRKLFGLTGSADVQDALLAGLLCALCFSGLFAMEQKGGMKTILCATPLGRGVTVRAKLHQSAMAALCIGLASCLPHLWQALRDYGLPALAAPAFSISDFEAVPSVLPLFLLLLFWVLCRVAACLLMGSITLWLGEKTGNLLATLCVSATVYCLPPLLCLAGMNNGIEWLGSYPLFHAVSLCATQGFNAAGKPYNLMWVSLLVLALGILLTAIITQDLYERYECAGVDL